MSHYDLPQSWETEETVTLLLALSRTQRRALRAYIAKVELGDMSMSQWLTSDDCPVSRAAWYRDGGANYLNGAQFQKALKACLKRAVAAQTAEEEKMLKLATRKLRLLVPKAVDELERLMQNGESDAVKLRASDSILDRAGVETAPKSQPQVATLSADQFAALSAEAKVKASLVNEAAAQAWDPNQKPDGDSVTSLQPASN